MRLVLPCAVLLLLLIFADTTWATHFAYGTISWTRSDPQSSRVHFGVNIAFRHGYFAYPPLGSSPLVGYYYVPQAPSYTYEPNLLSVQVMEIHNEDDPDWFLGYGNITYDVPSNVIGFWMYYYECCRLSTLLEGNNDQYALLFTYVNMTSRWRSPISTGLPREYFLVNQPVSFRVPAISPDDYPLTYALADSSESALPYGVPCGSSTWNPCPAGQALSVNSQTGEVSWTPKVVGVYAVQFKISDGASQIYLDFLMDVKSICDTCNKAPYFDPLPPTDITISAGQERVIDIVAVDPNPTDTITIVNSVLPEGATFVPISTGNPAVSRFRWTPSIDQSSGVVCFKARDSRGLYSFNNNCINMKVEPAPFIFVPGIIRNFPATHPDFNKARGPSGLAGLVKEYLDPITEKPELTSANAGNIQKFSEWFNDVAASGSQSMLYSLVLTQNMNLNANGRIFSTQLDSFYPINGMLLHDGQTDTNNNFFTYELHTFIEYLGGESYTFTSSDDMWIFLNNRLLPGQALGGTHAPLSYTVNMDQIASSFSLTRGNTYNLDVFYAHRTTTPPYLGMQVSNSSLCSALSLLNQDASLVELSRIIKYDQSNPASLLDAPNRFAAVGKAKVSSNTGVSVITAEDASESGAVWLASAGVPIQVKVLNGFQAHFTFKVTRANANVPAEGFAFVIQSQSATARGSEGGNLGYSGITNSVALEFDIAQTTGKNDPPFQHISLHTSYEGANDALESAAYYPQGSSYVGNIRNLPFTFDNSTSHRVRVDFSPGNAASWLRVFVNDNIRPLFEARLDSARLASALGEAAYVGFTSSSSDQNRGTVQIEAFDMVIVPAMAQASTPLKAPETAVAGVQSSVVVQLRDACQNALTLVGELPKFRATLYNTDYDETFTVPVTATDLKNGRYEFAYTPTTVGVHELRIEYATKPGEYQDIATSPWKFTVKSGPTNPANSIVLYGQLPILRSNALQSRGLECLRVTAQGALQDRANFLVPGLKGPESNSPTFDEWMTSAFSSSEYVACALNGAWTISGDLSLSSHKAEVQSVAYKLGVGVVNFAARDAFAIVSSRPASVSSPWVMCNSTITSSGPATATYSVAPGGLLEPFTITALSYPVRAGGGCYLQVAADTFRVPVGQQASFTIVSRDAYNNIQNSGESSQYSVQFTPTMTSVVSESANLGFYKYTISSQTAGIYSATILYGGTALPKPLTVYVLPGQAVASQSSITGLITTTTVNVESTFQLKLRDQFGNHVYLQQASDVLSFAFTSQTTNDPDATSIAADWNQALGVYTVRYKSFVSGDHTLEVVINGQEHSATAGVLIHVAPGPLFGAHSIVHGGQTTTAPSDTLAVDQPTRIYIQARDAFQNNREDPNPAGSNFVVEILPPAAASPATPTVVYDGQGRYYFDIVPTSIDEFSYKVELESAGTKTPLMVAPSGSMPITANVATAGALDKLSILSIPSGSVSAGSSKTVTIAMRDAYGNVRRTNDIADNVIITATTVDDQLFTYNADVAFEACDQGTCTVKLTGTKAGEYTLSVRVKSTYEHIINSPSEFTVTNGPLDLSKTLVSEENGSFSGVPDDDKVAILRLRDAYGNAVEAPGDNFELDIIDPNAEPTSPPLETKTCTATTPSMYSCAYKVPTLLGGRYTLRIRHVASSTTIFTATPSIGAVAGCYAEVTSVTEENRQAGSPIAIEVTDKDSNGFELDSSGRMRIDVSIQDGNGVEVWKESLEVGPSDPANGSKYAATFTFFVAGTATFTLNCNGYLSSNQAVVDIAPGPMSAIQSVFDPVPSTSVTAGEEVVWFIQPKDAYGNTIADPSGDVQFTASAPVDLTTEPDGTKYKVSFTLTKSGTQLFTLLYGGQAVASRTFVLNVQPAAIDVSKCKLSPRRGDALASFDSSYAVAGNALTTYIFVYDQFGNEVPGSPALESNFVITIPGDPDAEAVVQYLSGNIFTASLTFKKTSVTRSAPLAGHEIQVKYNSNLINGGVPYSIRVLSGQPDPTKCSVTASPPELLDGTVLHVSIDDPQVVYVINIRDAFENPWFGSATDVASQNTDATRINVVYTSQAQASVTFAGTVTPAAIDGAFTVTTIPTGNLVGAYTASIQVAGISLSSLLTQLVIDPGATDPSKTVVKPFGQVFINREASALIMLRDSYSNYRSGVDIAEEDVQVRLYYGILPCRDENSNNPEDDWIQDVSVYFEEAASGPARLHRGGTKPIYGRATIASEDESTEPFDTNVYYVYAVTEAVGPYTMIIRVNGEFLSCSTLRSYVFFSEPGDPSELQTSYDFTNFVPNSQNVDPTISLPTYQPSTSTPIGAAGNLYRLRLQLRDIYSNQVNKGGAAITLGEPADGESAEADWLNEANGVTDISVIDHGIVFGAQTGQIDLTFRPTKAGTFTLWLGLGPASSRARITPNGPTSFVVQPGQPRKLADVQWPTTSEPNLRAGQVLGLLATATDLYGNPITDASAYRISVILVRESSTLDPPPVELDQLRVTPTVAISADNPSYWKATFVVPWEGNYRARVVLRSSDGRSSYDEQTETIVIKHATCAQEFGLDTPYRCPDGTCVASHAECPGATPICDASMPYYCKTDGQCKATIMDCDCEAGQVRCPTGQCVDNSDKCLTTTLCPVGTVACKVGGKLTGQCRKREEDCPSVAVCPPGHVPCSDGRSCSNSQVSCPEIDSSDCPGPAGWFKRCPDGRCVHNIEDCATPVTCPSDKPFFCLTDRSCQATPEECPNMYDCRAIPGNPIRCPDGSCRASASDCPSATVCPVSWVLCENGACAPTLSECLQHSRCPQTKVRCPDGSCAENILLCPSISSCPPSLPVLCSDRSCRASIAECPMPSTCPSGTTRCPDGSCAAGTTCPVSKSCPSSSPVLCADGSCATHVASCQASPTCAPDVPVRCPDGSCRKSVVDCPSRTICPAKAPVRCLDGTCKQTADQCPLASSSQDADVLTAVTCPDGFVSCPGGECAISPLLCPTHVTCPLGLIKCNDGRCAPEAECPSKDNIDQCTSDSDSSEVLIQCPISASGIACAKSLADCPTGIVCPQNAPVRCLDSTCAVTLSACPPAPPDSPSSSRKPCPDGSWTTDICTTAVTCPPNTPFKCYDQTCRKSVLDCPTAKPCPSSAPYRCTDGSCATRPWECSPPVDGVCTDPSKPVKCPMIDGSAPCVAKREDCPEIIGADGSVVVGQDPESTSAGIGNLFCPAGYTRCRDGSCKATAAACPAFECSISYPYLCPNGACVKSEDDCLLENGCPRSAPVKCIGEGSCRAKISQCPRPKCASMGLLACPDGSCSTSCARTSSGCPVGKVRCFDGSCVSDYSVCTSKDNLANSCPSTHPIRCAHGLCVASETSCPSLPSEQICTDPAKPILCADGTCQASTELCRLILPCLGSDQVRCDDGTCMDAGVDPNVCSMHNSCPQETPVRCKQSLLPSIPILDGLCAASLGECYSPNGCPMVNFQPQIRCANGRCVPRAELCDVGLIMGNGCPAATPFKCWNGECVAEVTDCKSLSGCPPDQPHRCPDGSCTADPDSCGGDPSNGSSGENCPVGTTRCADGNCATDPKDCLTLMGCPVEKPIRCVDGTCKKYPATILRGRVIASASPALLDEIRSNMCSPVKACPSSAEVLCQDGSCAASASDCPAAPYPCMTEDKPILCRDGKTCVAEGSEGTCPDMTQCPPSAPVLCPNGACLRSLEACSKDTDSQATQLTGGSNKRQCSAGEITCFDGKCAETFAQCMNWSEQVIPDCTTRCADGTCLPYDSAEMCPSLPACPAGYYRDGATGACVITPPAYAPCPMFEERCGDGKCRPLGTCPSFNGCPPLPGLSYQCPNRECAADAASCAAAASRDPKAWAIRRLQDHAERQRVIEEMNAAAGPYVVERKIESPHKAVPLATIDAWLKSLSAMPTFVHLATNAKKAAGELRRHVEQVDLNRAKLGALELPGSSASLTASPMSPCTSGCYSMYEANTTSFVYDHTKYPYQEQLIAPAVTEMKVRVFSGLDHDPSKDIAFYFEPAASSVYFNATNLVHASRVNGDEGYPQTLTAAQSILSPVFKCHAGAGIVQPFSQPIYVQSNIDLHTVSSHDDVCLARLRRFPSLGYDVWECVYTIAQRTSGNMAYKVKADPTVQPSLVSSSIRTCKDPDIDDDAVYAFILAPLPAKQMYARNSMTWVRRNIVYIMLGCTGALFLICAIFYGLSRLARYRKKIEKVDAEIKKMEDAVADLEMFGTSSLLTDESVRLTSNPLATPVQDLAKRYSPDELKAKEERYLAEKAASAERQQVIGQLNTSIAEYMDKFRELQAEEERLARATGLGGQGTAAAPKFVTSPVPTQPQGPVQATAPLVRSDTTRGSTLMQPTPPSKPRGTVLPAATVPTPAPPPARSSTMGTASAPAPATAPAPVPPPGRAPVPAPISTSIASPEPAPPQQLPGTPTSTTVGSVSATPGRRPSVSALPLGKKPSKRNNI